jgi:hypothetical protein
MENNLNKDSMMECPRHGLRRPAFVCQHLQYGKGLGFNQPDESPHPEWPFENAWCDKCCEVLYEEGEWNDKSEHFAGIMAICEGCLGEIKKQNQKQ